MIRVWILRESKIDQTNLAAYIEDAYYASQKFSSSASCNFPCRQDINLACSVVKFWLDDFIQKDFLGIERSYQGYLSQHVEVKEVWDYSNRSS